MYDKYGIKKAALGIRHLLLYISNKKEENFNIVLNCLNEIKLWCLITSLCNNMDELFDIVPEFVLDNIFSTRVNKGETVEQIFGKGFKSNLDLPRKDEFKKIRGLLSHGKFTYNDGIINVFQEKYEATFDIKWLERLISVTLRNKRLGIQKGMSDVSVMSLINAIDVDINQFKEFIDLGIIQFYKVTALSGNKESISNAAKTEMDSKTLTFETLFQAAISFLRMEKSNVYYSIAENKRELKAKYKKIEEFFGNKIKVEDMPITLDPKLLSDEDFINLTFKDKIAYLARSTNFNDPILYNGIMVQNLLEMFENMRHGKVDSLNIFTLKESKQFLLKVYANIFFTGIDDKRAGCLAEKYGINARYVYAQKIYEEYLKALARSYKELVTYKGTPSAKKSCLYNIQIYTNLLSESANNPLNEFSWKMRNSIVHNQIEYKDGFMKFYITGKKLKLNHFSKKNNTWGFKDFINNRIIWEMVCTEDELLSLLDDLYEMNGVEVKVNISKYVKRKDYLKN